MAAELVRANMYKAIEGDNNHGMGKWKYQMAAFFLITERD